MAGSHYWSRQSFFSQSGLSTRVSHAPMDRWRTKIYSPTGSHLYRLGELQQGFHWLWMTKSKSREIEKKKTKTAFVCISIVFGCGLTTLVRLFACRLVTAKSFGTNMPTPKSSKLVSPSTRGELYISTILQKSDEYMNHDSCVVWSKLERLRGLTRRCLSTSPPTQLTTVVRNQLLLRSSSS